MVNPEDSAEVARPRKNTGRIITSGNIISSGSIGRVAQTPSQQVDDIPFIPAFDLIEASPTGALAEHEITLIAATLWTETAATVGHGSSRWLTAGRILSISQRL